jgi:hypothetical protein
MKNGLWITRDPKGDRAYSVWTTEPSMSDAHDEWVPDAATGGRQANVVVTESFTDAFQAFLLALLRARRGVDESRVGTDQGFEHVLADPSRSPVEQVERDQGDGPPETKVLAEFQPGCRFEHQ